MISVEFELADDLPLDRDLDIKEGPGRVLFRVGSHLTPEEMIAALNEGAAAVIAGGHWFQEWHGDIIRAGYAARAVKRAPRLRLAVHDEVQTDLSA